MSVPANLKYAKTHEWASLADDGLVKVGITDHAQEALGDIVFVELPEVGRKLAAGKECAVIESVKAASDIYAPVSGEVVAANSAVADAPDNVNKDAYGAWLFAIRPDDAAQCRTELDALLDAGAYAKVAESE